MASRMCYLLNLRSRLVIIGWVFFITWLRLTWAITKADSIAGIAKEEEEEEAHPSIAGLRETLISANGNDTYFANEDGDDSQLRAVFFGNLKKSEGEMVPVNVESFGAKGDGENDDTQAFAMAWERACSIRKSVFLVPQGRRYIVKPLKFKGPCHDGRLLIQIAGTVIAPDDPAAWDPNSQRNWLVFSNLNGATIEGGGILDGSGQNWWAQSCKINKTIPCRSAPTALTIDSSSNVRLRNLRFQNSQQMHIVIARSIGVQVTNLQVVAPATSPNTDGIHITSSQNVVVQGCAIATGDDCISIVSGSANVKIKEIVCGPGHGISIGSLGKDNSEASVSGIVVDGATLTGTTNGLRIKTWQGGSGFARGIRFQNVRMNSVANPIIIDQFYCDSQNPCENQTSAVHVSEVMYMNVEGTSKTLQSIKLACSDTVPCDNIILWDVDIQMESGESANYFCNNVMGFRLGSVNPSADCLQNIDRNKGGGNGGVSHSPQKIRAFKSWDDQQDLSSLYPN